MWARLGEKGDKASEKGKKVLEKMPPTSTRDKISYSGIFPKSFKLPCEKRCAPKNPNPGNKEGSALNQGPFANNHELT